MHPILVARRARPLQLLPCPRIGDWPEQDVHSSIATETRGRSIVLEQRWPVRAPRRRGLALIGPAFVAAIAYVDPGNFATNFSAGAKYGYLLLWVIVLANL